VERECSFRLFERKIENMFTKLEDYSMHMTNSNKAAKVKLELLN